MKETISVITICFNNLQELIETCVSVDSQTSLPDEHLIIDGSANDEILNWLTTTSQPAYRRWIHERDKGISDAFNKGVRNSTGTITHLLNSGDSYANDKTLATVRENFQKEPALMWTHGQYVQHRGDIDVVSGLPFEKDKLWKGMRTVAHPSMFIKKQVYDRHGLYDINYKIAMDYDMLVRMRDENFAFIPQPLVYFKPGGASNQHFQKGLDEVKKIYRTHIGKDLKLNAWQLRQQMLRLFMQTPIGKAWFQRKNKKNTV